ncbi:hypothetical protein [Ligilactobacillus cholophilus]|uniref:hypothetical protein n=1 Tax=Ligilactobacillus cholophilus TaxID=3050131 RepID=UPI0025AF3498|nr:hypothetical protein [Ligilactobacillus cholophilus]
MDEQNKLKTITFLPNGQEKMQTKDVRSLSTTGRLLAYRDQLKKNLDNGIHFTEILNELITTKNPDTLLTSIQQLSTYQLDSAYLIYPQQYSKQDFYLIFLSRLLGLHQAEKLVLQANEKNDELYHQFPGIDSLGYFTFQENVDGSAYYVERKNNEALFFIDFNKHLLLFNSESLTDLLIKKYRSEVSHEVLRQFELQLLAIGKFMKEDYGFDVDFNILDPSNYAKYPIMDAQMPQKALDKLFISASNADYMLVTGTQNEAILKLNHGIEMAIGPSENNQWIIQIKDPDNRISWFDILNKYDFLRDWYLNNLDSLEIKNDPRYY